MRVITLGTGAGRPSLHRASSATALEYNGEIFLFDCGENTQIQIMRANMRWGKLNAIFIGHMHGDHINGLPGLLASLSMSERIEPLQLFGPPGIKRYLEVLKSCHCLWVGFPLEVIEIKQEGLLLDKPDFQIYTAPLDHVIECWGYRFQEKERPGRFDVKKAIAAGVPDGPERGLLVRGQTVMTKDGKVFRPEDFVGAPRAGRSFAYCLDTKPCSGSRRLAHEVSCLVHEATFEQSLMKDARDWGHSTTLDAAKIAEASNAQQLIITHISQRYMQGKPLLAEARAAFPNTLLASDLSEFEIQDET